MNIEQVVFRTGDIIFTKTNRTVSNITCGIIDCPYNHVACVYIDPYTQQVYMWEMNGTGPRLVSLSTLLIENNGPNPVIPNLSHMIWMPLHRKNKFKGEWFHRVNDAYEYEKYVPRLESWIEYCITRPIQFDFFSLTNILSRSISLSKLRINSDVIPTYQHPTNVTCSSMLLASLYHLQIVDEKSIDPNVSNAMKIVCPADFYESNSPIRTTLFQSDTYYEKPIQLYTSN